MGVPGGWRIKGAACVVSLEDFPEEDSIKVLLHEGCIRVCSLSNLIYLLLSLDKENVSSESAKLGLG